MHVVVIAHTRFPISQPFAGGLESLTWHLVNGLVDRGHRVSVFAAPGTEPIPGVEHLWPEKLTLSAAAREDVSMPEAGWLQRHHAYLRLMLSLARGAGETRYGGRLLRDHPDPRRTVGAFVEDRLHHQHLS